MTRAIVFLDTSAWLAALSLREERHADCARLLDELARGSATLLTTNLIIGEMHGLLVRRRGAESGLALLDVVRDDPSFDVIRADAALESAATDRWLRRHLDLPLSLTDAVSFEVMRERGVRDAFTLDRHFSKVGFRMLPA